MHSQDDGSCNIVLPKALLRGAVFALAIVVGFAVADLTAIGNTSQAKLARISAQFLLMP
jgi:hypothetical protein